MSDPSSSINLDARVITDLKELNIPESYLSNLEKDEVPSSEDSSLPVEDLTSIDQDFANVTTRSGCSIKPPDRLTY